MAFLRVYIGDKVAEEFDLDKVTGTEFTESQRIFEATGRKLREEPPRWEISIFSVKTEDEYWHDFYDYDGRHIRTYSQSIWNAQRENRDFDIFFSVEHNPRYADK